MRIDAVTVVLPTASARAAIGAFRSVDRVVDATRYRPSHGVPEDERAGSALMTTKRGTGRERLIQAAWELWVENGPDGTTITEICERAGVSQATFFYHFRSVPEVIAERVKVMSH